MKKVILLTLLLLGKFAIKPADNWCFPWDDKCCEKYNPCVATNCTLDYENDKIKCVSVWHK